MICLDSNLPCFKDWEAAKVFHVANGGSWLGIVKQWRCTSCGGVHYEVVPVGDHAVSGSLPKRANFPFLRDETVEEMRTRSARGSRDGDLPVVSKPEKRQRKVEPKLKATVPQAKQGALW